MVSRFTAAPLELPAPGQPFERADLIFLGLDHSGHSYEGRVFLNFPRADHGTGRDHEAYAGSFYIFGHGGCFGDVGHCDIPNREDPFDLRPPHQLSPAVRILTVTKQIKALLAADGAEMTVTVVAHTPGDYSNDVLVFEKVRLATYA
jgi:tyrosinase